MKKLLAVALACLALAGCEQNDATVVSRNLSTAADNFEINRRIIFYNGITGEFLLTIEGLCSQEQTDRKLAVTCRTGATEFKKHFLGLSDNVTYFSEQLGAAKASTYFYRVVVKPTTLIPMPELR